MQKEEKFSWQGIIQTAMLVLGILGAVVPLHFSIRDDIRAMDTKVESNLTAIREEMRDFHGRLCAIEERNRGK